MGSGDQPMPWIHVKDLTGIITHAIENEHVSGVLNGTAPQVITNAQVTEQLSSHSQCIKNAPLMQFVQAFASALWRPAFIPAPDFVWNLVFGEERAAIITKGQRVACK